MDIELDLRQILVALLRRFWVLVISMIIVGGAAFSYSYWFITPLYSTSASMYVYNQENRTNASITQSDLTTSQKLVSTYIVILRSDTVLNQVSEKLGGQYSAAQIRGMVSAASINDTEAFRITVTNPNPLVAQNIANTIATVAPAEIKRVVKAGAVEVIDYATIPFMPSSPDVKRNTLIGVLIGLVLSAIVVILLEMVDTAVRSEEDLTEIFDIPVLGVIPRLMENDNGGRKNGKEQ
jgi:Capsular polysaccharide biosynthesis protein